MDKEIKEILEKRGYKAYEMGGFNGEETTHFIGGGDLITITHIEDADEEILEDIKGVGE